ncbi:MAG: hypothetical protein MZW92_21020 [Comamonadaceae bacterium]|nr:hypothetical protein [Comamonadaceae bacterium]
MRKRIHAGVRTAFGLVPRPLRHAVFRRMVECELEPDPRLKLRIVDTRQDLEAVLPAAARRLRRQRLHEAAPVRACASRLTTRCRRRRPPPPSGTGRSSGRCR